MRSNLAAAGVAILFSLAFSAGAQTSGGGYLAGHEPDAVLVIPQAPAAGSARDKADRAIFKATRALKDTPRWTLAQNDVKLSTPDFYRDFSCAVGVILDKTDPDIEAAYSPAKARYRRKRPYLRDQGPICVPRSGALDKSYDYPSGHASFAWATGLIVAETAPDRAGPILQRARAFGESRAVCGVHSASAVEEARTAASTVVAALDADAAFQADLVKARAEMTALRASPGAARPQACEAEQALTAATPW